VKIDPTKPAIWHKITLKTSSTISIAIPAMISRIFLDG
jgi:hypothetical protein